MENNGIDNTIFSNFLDLYWRSFPAHADKFDMTARMILHMVPRKGRTENHCNENSMKSVKAMDAPIIPAAQNIIVKSPLQ